MAKFLVTSGSKFDPMSYDEIIKPLAQATEVHKETQAAYDELAANAESIGQMIGTGPGSEHARKMYDDYMNSMNSYIDDLYENGYSVSAMRGLSTMRAQYGKNITGIANALERRRKVSESLWEMGQKDRSLMTEFDPAYMGLDNWLSNPEYMGPKTQSGVYLQQLTEESAKNFKNMIDRQIKEGKLGNGEYWAFDVYQGATPQQIAAAKEAFVSGAGPSDDVVVNGLVDIMRGVYNDSGVADWQNPQADAMAKDYIARGINAAMGQSDLKIQQNLGARYGSSGGSGSGSGGKKAPAEAPNYRNYEWGVGQEEYQGMQRQAVSELERDIKSMEALKSRVVSGDKGYKYNADELAERNARLQAIKTIEAYSKAGNPGIDRGSRKNRELAKAYQDVINEFPEYANFKYNAKSMVTPSTGVTYTQWVPNESAADEINRLQSDPNATFKRLLDKYGNGNPNATLDDLYATAKQMSDERALLSRPALFYDTESTNIQRGISSYLDNISDERAASGFVTNERTGEPIKSGEIAFIRKALSDKTARVGIDPMKGKAVILGHNDKGVPYYYSFSPDMFSNDNYAGYTGEKAQALFDYLHERQRDPIPDNIYEELQEVFIGGRYGNVGAANAIRNIAEWNKRHINDRYQDIANYIMDYLFDDILTVSSNRWAGNQGNDEKHKK